MCCLEANGEAIIHYSLYSDSDRDGFCRAGGKNRMDFLRLYRNICTKFCKRYGCSGKHHGS